MPEEAIETQQQVGDDPPEKGGVSGGLGTPVVFLTLCLFPLLHPAPSPSAHGAHRPGGEVRTLLLLGGGRGGRPRAGTGLGKALQLLTGLGTWVRGANPRD